MTEARWRGFPHEELYRMLHDGPGAPASATPSRRWAELTSALDEIGHHLSTALGASGTEWGGQAAGAAYDRLSPLAAWAKTTSEGTASMRLAVENQGDHIARARADMPVPEDVPPMAPDPSAPPAVQLAGTHGDFEAADTARAAGEQRAIEVMAAYEASTKANLVVLTPFPTPGEMLRDGAVRRMGGEGIEIGTQVSAVGRLAGTQGAVDQQLRPSGVVREVGGQFTQASAGASGGLGVVSSARPVAPGMSVGAAPMEHHGQAPIALGARRSEDKTRQRRAPAAGSAMAGPVDHHAGSGLGGVPPGAPPPLAGGALGAGGPVNPADKMAMRRYGPEAIGSNQWFADGSDDGPVRSVSGRNRDLGSADTVTENVSVDGEDHTLPPSVIGG